MHDLLQWPVEVDSFLCELSLAMLRVFIWFILDHLNPFPSITLLVTVFTDHVKLPNPVLQDKNEKKKVHILLSEQIHFRELAV